MGLQERIGFTSHVCSELLKGQNNLIYALCQYSEDARQKTSAYDQFIQLQQYHSQLQEYHQKLLSSYHKLSSDDDAKTAEMRFVNPDPAQYHTYKSEGAEAVPQNPQAGCGKAEVNIPPPLPPPLLFQAYGSIVNASSAGQVLSSSLPSSYPNRKWFYEQSGTSVSHAPPNSTSFTATLPFVPPKSQPNYFFSSSCSAAVSTTQAGVSPSPGMHVPSFVQSIPRSEAGNDIVHFNTQFIFFFCT